MTRVRNGLRNLRARMMGEAGQGLAEYGLILALIALVCVAALQSLGIAIADSAGFVALPQSL